MPLQFLIALVIMLVIGAAFSWRYLRLRRRLDAYVRALQRDPLTAIPQEIGELNSLLRAVSALTATFSLQISTLSHERDRLAAVLDQMTDGVLIADGEGLVRFANPAVRGLFGIPEPLGHSIPEVLRNHQLVGVWRRCQQTNALQSESVEIPASRQFLQLVVMPDKHAGGSLLLLQDLTHLRRLETVRRDFISNISHELRTPLASLRALTETLQDGALADPQAGPRFLDRIVTEVDALAQMTQELLDLSRIESGQVALELQKVSANKLLQSVADRMKMQAERAGLRLRVDCPEDLPSVRADPSRLEQVLVNLVHNAIKFTRPGSDVVLSAQVDGGKRDAGVAVRFSVSDEGLGIPADEAPRIFERFYRVDKSRAGGGTGLGLSVARHIVEAHGGKIWVESIEGQGSTFYFSIPSD